MTTSDNIKKILALLDEAYDRPQAFKKDDPVDVLVRTILSQNTTDKNSVPAFYALKRHFASWEKVRKARTRDIARIIRHAGLANIKAERIKSVLSEIKERRDEKGKEGKRRERKGRREGKVSLGFLSEMDDESALGYLESLKGVGPKTAACVLLFGFGKAAMPVDTHIFRVVKRLGIIGKDVNIGEAHKILTRIVPNDLIYDFHLGIIEHGRKTCRAQNPRCGVCVVYGLCKFGKKGFFRKRQLNDKKS